MKNPFIITGRIPEEYFCDRRLETQKIVRGLTNGDNICLMPPRRMGKSKLIQFCYDRPGCHEETFGIRPNNIGEWMIAYKTHFRHSN